MIDMPGYGFAFVNEEERKSWRDLVCLFYFVIITFVRRLAGANMWLIVLQMETYITTRKTLKRIFVIIDARHGESLIRIKSGEQ